MKGQPLAFRMKPKTFDKFYGQEKIVGEGRLLRRLIEADKLTSVIFYGPPGIGKTSLAKVIANTTSSTFKELNATEASKKDMQEIVAEAIKNDERVTLFIDEIHRFNKAQQDYLLPFVEDGTIILIGATTENPYFEVNKALLSRSKTFELFPLKEKDILNILKDALTDTVDGLGSYKVEVSDKTLLGVAKNCQGDARDALNTLELAVLTTRKSEDGFIHLTDEIFEDCMQKPHLRYDKDSTEHYDTISAFIKSMRGSDPQATNYYLAAMLLAGEDIKFIARRIMICASEDVGNADPRALEVAVNAAEAVAMVGMPEARIILAQAATYVALAPKSNASYNAINSAMEFIEKNGRGEIPPHLRDHGFGYKYAHEGKNHYLPQQYLPNRDKNVRFFEITEMGYEKIFKNYHNNIGNKQV